MQHWEGAVGAEPVSVQLVWGQACAANTDFPGELAGSAQHSQESHS